MLVKIGHYGLCGIVNEALNNNFLTEKMCSNTKFNFTHVLIKHWAPWGLILWAILFLTNIVDLNHTQKYCKRHHIWGETNSFHSNPKKA